MPVTLNVPATFVPVVVIINLSVRPPTDTEIFPFGDEMSTLDVPLRIFDPAPTEIFVKFAPSPEMYVKTPPVPDTLPVVTLPETANEVKVPVLVMFGCALVVTVPALVAKATVPDTFAPATAFAVVAKETAPVTFAPGSDDRLAPFPVTYVKTPPVPKTLPADTLPVTDNVDNVPTLVMFG